MCIVMKASIYNALVNCGCVGADELNTLAARCVGYVGFPDPLPLFKFLSYMHMWKRMWQIELSSE